MKNLNSKKCGFIFSHIINKNFMFVYEVHGKVTEFI